MQRLLAAQPPPEEESVDTAAPGKHSPSLALARLPSRLQQRRPARLAASCVHLGSHEPLSLCLQARRERMYTFAPKITQQPRAHDYGGKMLAKKVIAVGADNGCLEVGGGRWAVRKGIWCRRGGPLRVWERGRAVCLVTMCIIFIFFISSCIGFLSLYNYFPLFNVDIVIFQFLYYFHLVHGEN